MLYVRHYGRGLRLFVGLFSYWWYVFMGVFLFESCLSVLGRSMEGIGVYRIICVAGGKGLSFAVAARVISSCHVVTFPCFTTLVGDRLFFLLLARGCPGCFSSGQSYRTRLPRRYR